MKRIMIRHSDNDFCRAWEWIGEVMLIQENYCGEKIYTSDAQVVQAIRDLIPLAIKNAQYCGRDVFGLDGLIAHLNRFQHRIDFSYNVVENDWMSDGGREYLIIDFENKTSELY